MNLFEITEKSLVKQAEENGREDKKRISDCKLKLEVLNGNFERDFAEYLEAFKKLDIKTKICFVDDVDRTIAEERPTEECQAYFPVAVKFSVSGQYYYLPYEIGDELKIKDRDRVVAEIMVNLFPEKFKK